MRLPLLLLISLLAGCAAGSVAQINGVYHHVDTDRPESCQRKGGGCYESVDGEHHIYYSAVSPAYVVPHELGHADGMLHTDWSRDAWTEELCAIVVVPSKGYPLGAKICVDGRRERIILRSDHG